MAGRGVLSVVLGAALALGTMPAGADANDDRLSDGDSLSDGNDAASAEPERPGEIEGAEGGDPSEPSARKELAPSRGRRIAAGVTAFVPGAFVHGAGHFVLGEIKTGLALLGLELGGLLITGIAFRTIQAVGVTRDLMGPLAFVLVTGLGTVIVSFLADAYGVLVPEKARGDPPPRFDAIEAELGPAYVRDRVLAHRSLLRARVLGRWRRARVGAEADVALNVRMHQFAGMVGYRMLERMTGKAAGAFVDGSFTLRNRGFVHDGFRLVTGEVFVLGRLPLRVLGRTLSGTFAELGLGYGIERARYDESGRNTMNLFLARVAFGAWFGRSEGGPRTEISLYYEHRRDTLAGGVLLRGVTVGYLGYFGARGDVWWTDSWGFGAYAEIGSAPVLGAVARYRYGVRR